MLVEDPRRTHVVADHRRVLDLFSATNQPLVQPQGRAAEPAQAVVVAVQAPRGLEVLVALSLAQSGANVIYAPHKPVKPDELQQAIDEATTFAESMGFILDTSGWQGLDPVQRQELLARLPQFHPPSGKQPEPSSERARSNDPLAAVARLVAAFSLLVAAALGGCSGVSAEQRRQAAEIHYDLGTNLVNEGNAQGALSEYLQAEREDPDLPQVHNALGLLYGFSFDKPAEAEEHFKRALDVQKDFSEAANNYGAFLLARGRFVEAVAQFERALVNPLYAGRAIAESNLGWALYKTGQTDRGIGRIRAALLVAPKYCKGWRQLGTIYSELDRLEEASESFSRYASVCPEAADAWLQQGKVLARRARPAEARAAFRRCAELGRGSEAASAAECSRFLKELGAP